MKNKIQECFQNPPARYRGAPFWAWNGKLDKGLLKEQIDVFEKMGFGGFHIHSRIGLATEYLGTEFMECVKLCQEYAKKKGMLTYLYDEDKWPSGYGAGRVTIKKEYCARYLLFSPLWHSQGHYERNLEPTCRLTEDGELTCLSAYRVRLKEGRLLSYERADELYAEKVLAEQDRDRMTEETVWYAYLVVTDKLPWFNEQAYADTLKPEAVQEFLRVSYEPYRELLGEEFSVTVPSIFTDEPQFIKFQNLEKGEERKEVGIPYSESVEAAFLQATGQNLMDCLPEIFWEKADDEPAWIRCEYFNTIADVFAESYAGTLGRWCEENNIQLTGHLMEECGLENQSRCVGDAMRAYYYFQRVGIDILANRYEYSTAKQAQSVARQMGREGLTSELYGVTNWDFDFRGHKLQGDWQAALGVTLRVPHLAWMFMGGESKRDYPAPIDAHSPWYERYRILEDYFGRVNSIMERGNALADIAVVHPVESMFLSMGPDDATGALRHTLEEQFQTLTRWLLFGQLDFDFLDEKLLTKLDVNVEKEVLQVGKMRYRVVVVPPIRTLRSTTVRLLKAFRKKGGRVLFMGKDDFLVDARKEENALCDGRELWEKSDDIGFDRYELYRSLEPFRSISIKNPKGIPREDLIYQLREDADNLWLFVAHGKNIQDTFEVFPKEDSSQVVITIKGCYRPMWMNAFTGETQTPDYETDGERTVIYAECREHDSLLFGFTKEEAAPKKEVRKEEQRVLIQELYLKGEADYALEEPNVLLWDMAEFSLDGGEWQGAQELLRIDDIARRKFGYRCRTDSFPQPWLSVGETEKEHEVRLRLKVTSRTMGIPVELAIEEEPDWELWFNGKQIRLPETSTFFVDSVIHRVPLGELKCGDNVLECRIPFGPLTNLEWMYLTGAFSVRLYGQKAILESLPEKIGFAPYENQGFPFYGGNFCYDTEFVSGEGEAELIVGEYDAPLLEIEVDGGAPIPLFAAPYRAEMGYLKAGKHHLRIRSFGSRINQFGQLHNCNRKESYFGPKTWRTTGDHWCYEYQLHSCGLKKSPRILVYSTEE